MFGPEKSSSSSSEEGWICGTSVGQVEQGWDRRIKGEIGVSRVGHVEQGRDKWDKGGIGGTRWERWIKCRIGGTRVGMVELVWGTCGTRVEQGWDRLSPYSPNYILYIERAAAAVF